MRSGMMPDARARGSGRATAHPSRARDRPTARRTRLGAVALKRELGRGVAAERRDRALDLEQRPPGLVELEHVERVEVAEDLNGGRGMAWCERNEEVGLCAHHDTHAS